VRRAVVAGAVASAAALVAAPAYAGTAAEHYAFSFDETATTSVDGLGPGCPDFTGTMFEDRHDDLAGVMLGDGTVHGRTLATSRISLVPDTPGATSYTGSVVYRETGTYVNEGEDDWRETATVHGVLTGDDGSEFGFTEVVHMSVDARGTVRSSFDRMHCS
jgi:hypothetical protein